MFTALSRPYKERSTGETINIIRNILVSYDLSPDITFIANPYPEVHSASLSLPLSKGGFSANGKGRSEEYCLASAYAEFVERLQNGMHAYFSRTLQSQISREFGFYYDPREKFLTKDEFRKLPEEISNDLIRYSGQTKEKFIQSYYEQIASNKMAGAVSVPFYCFRTEKDEYLPFNLLLAVTGSNGMAAGNSYEEAVYQALCEILERWAAALVFYNRLTPPTVSKSYLSQFTEECQIINKIEENGKYRVTVKDFSAGKGIPAVGIIIQNIQQNIYRLNIGCDTSFQIALSRCLTEVFQGYSDEEAFDQVLLDIPQEYPLYFRNDDEDALDLRYEVFSDYIRNGAGTGVFPPSLFASEASYQFDADVFTTKGSYQEEVKRLVEFLHSLNLTVFVRDVSFLGFPSVFVYIPEISTLGKKNAPVTRSLSTYSMIEADKLESGILQLDVNSREDCLSLASRLRTLPAYALIKDFVGIKLEEGSLGTRITVSFLLAQLWFRLGELDSAAEAFMVFQKGNPDESEYYKAMGKYMDLLASGHAQADVHRVIEAELGQTAAVRQACDDLENHRDFFNKLPLPKCPNCSACPLNADCVTRRLLDVSRALYPTMKEALLKQAETTR